MTTFTLLVTLLFMIAITKSETVKSKDSNQFPPLEKLIGHGIAPNLAPEYGPPRLTISLNIL